MQAYHLHKEAHPHIRRPQILGLTASAVFNLHKAEEHFAALEASLDSVIVTVRQTADEAASYFKKPIEKPLFYAEGNEVLFPTEAELLLEELEIWEYVKEIKIRRRIDNVKSVSLSTPSTFGKGTKLRLTRCSSRLLALLPVTCT